MTEHAEHLQPSPDARAEISDADLIGVLAARVESLVERFRAAQIRIEELDEQLAERDRWIRELTQKQEGSERCRKDIRKRVDRLIEQVERLERGGE